MFQSIMYEAFNLQELSSATEVLAAELKAELGNSALWPS